MSYVIALLSLLVRMVRPSRGLHAAPLAVRRDVQDEARANRVRRYARPLPAWPSGPGYDTADADEIPTVPAPRRAPDEAPAVLVPVPADYVPVVAPEDVQPQAAMVRGHFRHWEAVQARARVERADRSRLGLAVLADLATTTTRAGVTA